MNNSELWIVKGNYTDVFGFDLIPSNLSLYTMDLDLAAVPMKEVKLKRALEACVEAR